MRILVGWDDLAEAELIDTFLNVDENEALVCTDAEELAQGVARADFETVLLDDFVHDHC